MKTAVYDIIFLCLIIIIYAICVFSKIFGILSFFVRSKEQINRSNKILLIKFYIFDMELFLFKFDLYFYIQYFNCLLEAF